MNMHNPDNGWFTRKRLLTLALVLATLLALVLCYLLVQPFIPAIAFALALAVATERPFNWLRGRLRNDTTAATIGVILVAVVIVVPVAFLGVYIVQEAIDSIQELQGGDLGWRNAIDRQPQLREYLDWVTERFDVQAQIQSLSQTIAGRATDFLKGSVAVVTQLVVTLFVLFFLFRDRQIALQSLRRSLPLSEAETDRIFHRVASTIQATVNGSLTVSLVQSLLAGMMYAFLGVPGAVLWGAATFIAALVPVFGTVLVWGPITIYLLLVGSLTKAAILAGWGVLAVGMIDNFLYPFLVGGKLRIHTVPTFFSILGGISAFGPVGLILGPIVLAVTLGLMEVWSERTTQGQAAEETTVEESPERPRGRVPRKSQRV